MKNLRQSRKALSPVVASIILIAVTVAVSIAVAAWMGALTTGFMATEELKITGITLTDSQAKIYVKNTGSTTVTIDAVYIDGTLVNSDVSADRWTLTANQNCTITIDNQPFAAGQTYQFKIVTSKGNPFVYTATGPTS